MLEISIISIVQILDQVTKYLSERYLALGASSPVIQGVFQFTNVHNTGAAWGMLAGGRWLFIVITLVTVGLLCWLLLRRRKTLGLLARLCVALLIAGATGNLIDRVLIGYVRDMFDFCLINFPVFNVADCAVSVGVSGPGVVKCALEAVRGQPFDEVAETIKRTAFRITRVGQLVAREASRRLNVPFGIVDLSLAPTPTVGDSVAAILEEMGLES